MESEFETTDEQEVQSKFKLKTELIVVCILTFAVSFILLLWNTWFICFGKINNFGSQGALFFFFKEFIAHILCIAGCVLLLCKLKWGYWIYCLGQIPPVLFAVYFAASSSKDIFGGLLTALFTQFIPIGFWVMVTVARNTSFRKVISTIF